MNVWKIRLARLVAQNFRCFELLDMRLGLESNASSDDLSGLTVIVAKNGQGKTAVLDAIRYLMGRYLSKFRGVKTPAAKETDFRISSRCSNLETDVAHFGSLDESPYIQQSVLGVLDMKFAAQADFMGLTAFLWTGMDGGACPWVRWDSIRRKDNTSHTKRIVSAHRVGVGMKFLGPYVEEYIRADASARPLVYPVIAYYGTDRKLTRQKPGPMDAMRKTAHRQNMYVDCLHAGLNYRQLVEWIFRLENRQLREAKELKDFNYTTLEQRTIELAISKMLPGFSNLRTTTGSLNLQVDVDENGVKNARLVDEQLSDGYKVVLTMVVDIVARILEGNAMLPGMTEEDLLNVPGIVLIDEIDLHLHPAWQQTIVPDLRRTFPNIQFIVTTHSPQVVSSVPKECLRLLDNGCVKTIDTQTDGVESQLILAHVFGVDAVSSENDWAAKLNRYAGLMARGECQTDECLALSEALDQHYGKQYQPLSRIRLISRFANRGNGGM